MPTTYSRRLNRAIEGLTPGYFALVMATGIVSVGLDLADRSTLSLVLLWIGVGAHVLLIVLTLWRIVAYTRAVVDDLLDPRRAFGFFTFIAGTNVLGVRCANEGWYGVTAVLLAVAGVVWLVLGYVVPWTAVLGRAERPVLATANGSWFVWVVASQSVAVAAATLEPHLDGLRRELAVIAVICWSVGVVLYAAVGIMVALRLMLYDFGPEELTAPYWVAMGALSITVLAGARMVEMVDTPMVEATRDLVAGVSVVFWAFATWLIPVLIAAGWWRHFRHRIPLVYDSTLWSMVFPLGMYAVAGIYLGQADRLPVVEGIGHAWLWLAVAVWLVVFLAMAVHQVSTVMTRRSERA